MRRVITISDLHIGGANPAMLGHPEALVDFLTQLAEHPARDEIELVVAGDFIDFLAEAPFEPWTPTEARAAEKLEVVFHRVPELFDAFARCAARLRRFTVLLGNHDIELAYPRVRDSLFRRLGTDPHRCHFVSGNEGYRVGELLIEHGNRYDSWNAVDHDGLRQIASAASRGERPPRPLAVCPGSLLVHGAMNPLKSLYHFVDLLKPEGKIHALLLLEFEPTIVKKHLPELFRFAKAWVAERYSKAEWTIAGDGITPTAERLVSMDDADALPVDVQRAFYEELADLDARREHRIGIGDTLALLGTILLGKEEDGLASIFKRGEAIEPQRLRKLQVALRGVPNRDRTFEKSFPDGACYTAAKKMVEADIAKVVVMGHTHLARNIPLAGDGCYVNTGTWADVIEIGESLLEDTAMAREALIEWLRNVVAGRLDGIREHRPSYADVLLNDDGRVVLGREMLRWHPPSERFA